MSWTDDIPEPQRDLDDLRSLVAAKAGRLRNRRRLGLASGAVAVVAVLLAVASLPGDSAKPRQLEVANRPDTSTTSDPSLDDEQEALSQDVSGPTTTVAGRTPTTARTRGGAATTTTVPPPSNRGCADQREETRALASVTDLRRAIAGTWILCQPPSFFGGSEAGLEVRPDGTWSKLVRAADGRIMRQRNWDNAGRWHVPSEQQADFITDGQAGFSPASVTFTPDRNKAHFLNPQRDAQYVRVPSSTVVTNAPDPGSDDCTRAEGGVFTPRNAAELRTAATGAWRLCQAPSAFGTDEAGLELRADGSWSKLRAGPGGSFERMTGGDAGTWEAVNEQQLNLDGPSSGGVLLATFAAETPKMRLNNVMPGHVANYVKVPAGTTITG